jgi:hypothetical protein
MGKEQAGRVQTDKITGCNLFYTDPGPEIISRPGLGYPVLKDPLSFNPGP